MRPPSQVLRTIAEAQARIFGTTPPAAEGTPVGLRTGAKYLRKRLVGPSMLNYYPKTLNTRPLSRRLYRLGGPYEDLGWMAPDGSIRRHLVAPEEMQRLEDVQRKKAMGKGPPTKGQGRRASLKSKKGR